jgi:hypothetical protein
MVEPYHFTATLTFGIYLASSTAAIKFGVNPCRNLEEIYFTFLASKSCTVSKKAISVEQLIKKNIAFKKK